MSRRTATVLLVALALTGCGSHNSSSHRSAPLPTSTGATSSGPVVGPPPEIPWWSRGVLHVSEGTIRTSNSHVIARGGTTIVGPYHGNGTWLIQRGDQLVPLVAKRDTVSPPVLSANGRFAAWTTSKVIHRYTRFVTESSFAATAYDVGRGRVTGTTTIESRVSCCDAGGVLQTLGVDDDGAVVLHVLGRQSFFWHPGRAPVQIRLPLDQWLDAGDQWPHGIAYATHQDGALPAAFARVDHDGHVHRIGAVPVASTGVWSADGSAYAYTPLSKSKDFRARVWRDGEVTVLEAPRRARVIMWESPTKVLLERVGDVDVDPVYLYRCDVDSRICESAGKPLRHVHLPGE